MEKQRINGHKTSCSALEEGNKSYISPMPLRVYTYLPPFGKYTVPGAIMRRRDFLFQLKG